MASYKPALKSDNGLILHVDCGCGDQAHYVRLAYDGDESMGGPSLYLSYGLDPFPLEKDPGSSGDIGGPGNQWVYKWNHLKWWFKCKYFYLSNIWYAIKGRPQWFRACVDVDPDDVAEIKAFLNKHYPPKV